MLCVVAQVFGLGGAQADELELDLEVFGSLSMTLDDLPKDGQSSSLDAASDAAAVPVRRPPPAAAAGRA